MDAPRSSIVTGSASGIGAAMALLLAKPGAELTLHTRRAVERLESVADRAREQGATVEIAVGDLAEAGVAKQVVAAHLARFNRLDHLVANAGFPLLRSLEEMTAEDIAYAFQGNSQSFFELVQASAPALKLSEQARVVALGSFTAHLFRADMPQFPASAASKGAIEVAVRALALGLAKDGITVNCVVPGYTEKDAGTHDRISDRQEQEVIARIPLGRLGKPADVASMIAFLLSEKASYISGQIIHVNGGLI